VLRPMEDLQLPPELERLEHFLARGPRARPSAALRQRVMADVRSELHRRVVVPKWRFVAAFAATFLMGVSLSLAVAQATSIALQPRESAPSLREVAKRIRHLSPDLSPEESVRRAMLLEIAARAGCRTSLSDKLGVGNVGLME
jgi:hypothetical protein